MLHHLKKIIIPENKFVPAVKPSNIPFDATLVPNNIAVWDGDVTLTNLAWIDTAAVNTITMFNLPVVNPIGLNGHGTVLFNGVNQYGNTITPVILQPYTIYLVMRQVTWTVADYLLNDGVANGFNALYQGGGVSPRITWDTNGDTVITNQLILNTFNVITLRRNRFIRIGLNNQLDNGGGFFSLNGINLARKITPVQYGNCEYSYIILRNTDDPIWLQNNFINWLKTRFAI